MSTAFSRQLIIISYIKFAKCLDTIVEYLITLSGEGTIGVAVAGLTSQSTGYLPVVRSTAVTVLPYDIGQTGTLASHPVTCPLGPVCAQDVAHTCCNTRE